MTLRPNRSCTGLIKLTNFALVALYCRSPEHSGWLSVKAVSSVYPISDHGREETFRSHHCVWWWRWWKEFLADRKHSGILDVSIKAMLDHYLNLSEIQDPAHNQMSFSWICEQLQQDQQLMDLQEKYQNIMCINQWKNLDDIICYVYPGDNPDEEHYPVPTNVGANCELLLSSYGAPWRKAVAWHTATALPSP